MLTVYMRRDPFEGVANFHDRRHVTGEDWSVDDGFLSVYDATGTALATYTPGTWALVRRTAK